MPFGGILQDLLLLRRVAFNNIDLKRLCHAVLVFATYRTHVAILIFTKEDFMIQPSNQKARTFLSQNSNPCSLGRIRTKNSSLQLFSVEACNARNCDDSSERSTEGLLTWGLCGQMPCHREVTDHHCRLRPGSGGSLAMVRIGEGLSHTNTVLPRHSLVWIGSFSVGFVRDSPGSPTNFGYTCHVTEQKSLPTSFSLDPHK